ncbi:hypothetical protein [Thermodesulfobacterium geofontis]|uniref:hypothetical protein n=1 Tax=Thermodesulfobacterium geofontis TaxID=1295609 RepID=UPI00117FD348|nr:hypothetical protein [Thermodesulfobacterium geofontis]
MDTKKRVMKPPLEFIRIKIIPDKIDIKIFKEIFSAKNKLSKLNVRYNKTQCDGSAVNNLNLS